MGEHVASSRSDALGHQVVDVVVKGGYRPDTIHARAGVPIRLVFHRQDVDPCFARVVFSSPRIDRHLLASDATIVDLPAQGPGTVRFTCGMGRYRGRIEVADGDVNALVATFRRQGRRIQNGIGTAVARRLYSLPLITLVAFVALDAQAALLLAVSSLTLVVIGSRWALDRSAPTTP